MIFQQCAGKYIEAHEGAWRNVKHAQQWTNTLTTYVYPVIGALRPQAIDTDFVMRVLQPLWLTKTETAKRLRGKIESILDWAKVQGLHDGENPARWSGHLDHLLEAPSKVQVRKHHAALPHPEVAAFAKVLRSNEAATARALEFTILTATRTSETLGAGGMSSTCLRPYGPFQPSG